MSYCRRLFVDCVVFAEQHNLYYLALICYLCKDIVYTDTQSCMLIEFQHLYSLVKIYLKYLPVVVIKYKNTSASEHSCNILIINEIF